VTQDRPTLLLLDGHSLAYRAFYALPVEKFATADGTVTNAVYGFTSMLLNLLRDERPTHAAVAFDVSRTTFRTAEFPAYKATRSASPAEFGPQIGLIRSVLEALALPVIALEGFEADDVIATLSRQAERDGLDVLVVTGDRDAFQLVDERITVLYPRKGVSDLARMTPLAVEERYGIRPDQYADFAALRGDPSDNLPGIPGVGEKTAAKWIAAFGSVGALIDRADEVPGKAGQSLREHAPAVLLNRRLTQLVDDAPVGLGTEDLRRSGFDRAGLDALFDRLEFRVLRDRVHALTGDPAASDPDSGADPTTIDGSGFPLAPGAFATSWAGRTGAFGLAVTGRAIHGTGTLDLIGLAHGDDAVHLDPQLLDADDRRVFGALLADPAQRWTVHDLNATGLLLVEAGWSVPAGPTTDTELAAYLLAPDARGYELDLLCRARLGRDLPGGTEDTAQLTLGGDDARSEERVRASARALLELGPLLRADLAAREASDLHDALEIPLTRVIIAMERAGVAVASDELRGLARDFDAVALEAVREAEHLAGRPVNLASPKQLQTVLFDDLDMPRTKRTKTGFSTDAESLQQLLDKTGHPFLVQVMRHRDAAKLRASVEGLLAAVSPDGRVRTTLRQTIAATGRLSSTDPNLQNIPVRTAEGRRIRACFTVGQGYAALMTADYSQIEMRIMAHASQDAGLIAAFQAGEDLHRTMAAEVFGVRADQVDAEMRRRIKAMSYGLAYGLSAFGLARQLGTSNDEARALMDQYFERFGGVRDYLDGVVDQARRTGYTETILGRRRYLPDLASDNRQRREAAERMALNAPIQGSAADIIKRAMLGVARGLDDEGLSSRLVLQIHDELLLEIVPGEETAVESLVRDRMAAAYALAVPLDVSVGLGADWDAAAH
jgi:DNA polymerase-1